MANYRPPIPSRGGRLVPRGTPLGRRLLGWSRPPGALPPATGGPSRHQGTPRRSI